MELMLKNDMLEMTPDVMQFIRSKYNLNEPERMKEAISILDDWVRQQPHFKKKDFPSFYLETFLISSKGSIEKTKMRLDKYCTLRTLLPQYFGRINVKYDLGNTFNYFSSVLMPKCTPDHYRINILKILNSNFTTLDYLNYYRYGIVLAEYVKSHDYVDGFIFILDVSDVNITEFLSRVDLVVTRQALSIFLDCYGMRLKSIHIITASKLVTGIVSFLQQILSSKLSSRICVNKSGSELCNIMDKKILPKEYGGEDKSIRELQDKWIEAIITEEHLEFLESMSTAASNESLRRKDKFNEEYAGMPGTFRSLNVD